MVGLRRVRQVGAPSRTRKGDPLERDKVVDEVRSILVEQLGVDASDVTEEASFQEDLNADSLDLVELIMEMEDRFKVKIPDEEAEKITTVGKAVDYVMAHQS
ncbi:MAG: acyl carrier protein [Thermoleophilia bacterium]|nr:acyl carrier protein [Thermoleophilia bacterium]